MKRNLVGLIAALLLSTGIYSDYVERPYSPEVKGKTRLGTVYFATGSYELNKDGRERVRKIAHMLEIYHTYEKNRRIRITGYANHEGDSEFNLHLGLARAERLARALDEYGISMENAVIASHGESKSALTEKNYRRAEVWLEPDTLGFYGQNTGLYMFFVIATFLIIGFVVYWTTQKSDES